MRGSNRATRDVAPSCKLPEGRPSSSRSIRPSDGSGVSRSTPASSSAREFAQAPWWSRLCRSTGRSGTTASRSAAVGLPPGNAGIAQPPPVIHSASGCAAAYAAIASRNSSRVSSSDRSQRCRSSPPWIGCTCASVKPGDSSPPARSTTSAPAPCERASGPTAAIRPPSTSTSRSPRWRWPSKTRPPVNTILPMFRPLSVDKRSLDVRNPHTSGGNATKSLALTRRA